MTRFTEWGVASSPELGGPQESKGGPVIAQFFAGGDEDLFFL